MTRPIAYLHGFRSSPLSRKGVELQRRFRSLGVQIGLPNLNRPSFAQLTYTDALEAVEDWVDSVCASSADRVSFIGSSMGGYLTARWAELNPGRVGPLVLLCPGFSLSTRWPELLGADIVNAWKRQGYWATEDAAGQSVLLHYAFLEDTLKHPAEPDIPTSSPTLIIHGNRDEIVPIEGSRTYAATRNHVELIEVDDDHSLTSSIDLIFTQARAHLLSR